MAMKLYGKYWTLKISMLFVEPKCLSGEKSSTLFFRFPIESILRERERFDDKEKIGNDGKGQENTFQSMNFNKQASTQKEHPISLCRPRACHGNYPPACHTKLTLILPLEKSNSLFFRSSALSSESRVYAAQWIANAHLQSSSISIGFPLPFFPPTLCVDNSQDNPHSICFTWWNSCVYVWLLSWCVHVKRIPRGAVDFLLKSVWVWSSVQNYISMSRPKIINVEGVQW